MILITIPYGWEEVSEESLETYLKTCPDYVRRCYAETACYSFRHNNKEFAVITDGKVFVDPSLLVHE